MRARDRSGRVLLVPADTPGVGERYGLTTADLQREAWAIEPSGRKHGGAAAVNAVLRELGAFWRLVALVRNLPGGAWLEDILYRWVATHRHRFS